MKTRYKAESKYNFTNINHTMIIPENSQVERRLAKSAGGKFKHKKHSFDGKIFQAKATASFYNNGDTCAS